MSIKRVLVIGGAPFALATILGGSVAFASQLGGGNAEDESFHFEPHERAAPGSSSADDHGCPFHDGGAGSDSDAGVADQT